jgi:hypothetical protein
MGGASWRPWLAFISAPYMCWNMHYHRPNCKAIPQKEAAVLQHPQGIPTGGIPRGADGFCEDDRARHWRDESSHKRVQLGGLWAGGVKDVAVLDPLGRFYFTGDLECCHLRCSGCSGRWRACASKVSPRMLNLQKGKELLNLTGWLR